MRTVAGPVESQVQADQRRRRRWRRLDSSTNTLDRGTRCGALGRCSGPGGQRLQLAKAFGKIEGRHGAPLSNGAHGDGEVLFEACGQRCRRVKDQRFIPSASDSAPRPGALFIS
jgi:hypothetical protein